MLAPGHDNVVALLNSLHRVSQQDQPAFWQAVLTEHCGFKRKRERKRAHHRRMGGMHVGGVWEEVIEGGYDQGTLCICMKLSINKQISY